MYDLVCWKIFCFWVKSILGNYEITLHSYFLPGDIDWYGCRWTDVHCFSIVDCRWHYSIGDVTFITEYMEQRLEIIEQAFDQIELAILEDNSDLFIGGNNMIQAMLGRQAQFTSQDEFDALMDMEDAFVL